MLLSSGNEENIMQFPIEIIDNHVIVIDNEKRLLIDTGSPITISHGDEIEIFDSKYPTNDKYHGANIDAIGNFVGCELDALIGNDILKNFPFTIDFENQLFLIWDALPIGSDFLEDYIQANFSGIPTINVEVNKVYQITSWLDTGAKISYIKKEYVQQLEVVKNKKDFFPGYGEFEVPIYKIMMTFCGKDIPFEFGVLPSELEKAMLTGGIKSIVGADIFKFFTLTFSHDKNKIYIKYLL